MARDDNTRFRITAWPTERLPIPWGPARTRYKIEGGTLLASADELGDPIVSHHEVYLDLLSVDLDDDDAILAFVNRHGPLSILRPDGPTPFNGFTDHPFFRSTIQSHLEKERSAALQDWVAADEGSDNWIITESVVEFQWQAGCLHDLVAAWRFVHEGEEPDQLQSWVWDGLQDGYSNPTTREGAAHLLARGLDVGLAAFHPHIRVGDDSLPYHGAVGYYQICCLELFNHIVEAAVYRTCANEPCGRLFVRQTGRAEHGQHRTQGVKYCSTECARAQAQRKYRRRKSKNRKQHPENGQAA